MQLQLVCVLVLLHIPSPALFLEIEIKAEAPSVMNSENDLVISCYITDPGPIISVFDIELLKNKSGSFETIVSMYNENAYYWKDKVLQNRSTVSGSLKHPGSAGLNLTIDKKNVQCPGDFSTYKCGMTGFNKENHYVETYYTKPITLSSCAQKLSIPTVRVMENESDTQERQFADTTVLKLSCEVDVRTDPKNTIRWCVKKASQHSFKELTQNASLSGCQCIRSSSIIYTVISSDKDTQFLCETGNYTLCETGTIIQYVNISSLVSSVDGDRHEVFLTNSLGVVIAATVIIVIVVAARFLRKRSRRKVFRDDNIYTEFKVYDLIRESIPVRRFIEHVEYRMKNDKEELNEEYQALLHSHEKEATESATESGIVSKKELARSSSIPYEFNRVKLQRAASGSKKDYINASLLMDGLYIMTQCPLPKSTVKFWQMIWEQCVPSIVVLSADHEQRRECYFPDKDGEVRSFGKIDVELLTTYKESRDITTRSFKLSKESQSRTVHHFYVSNVEMCRVQEQMLNLIDILTRTDKKIATKGPCAVHGGSYGMDYSSVFVVVDYLVKSIDAGSSSVDVYRTVTRLLKERMFLIHSVDQYCMIYICIQSYLQHSTEVIRASSNLYEDLY